MAEHEGDVAVTEPPGVDPLPPGAPSPPDRRLGHVRALDGIRGLAVALVVVYHFAPDVLPAGFIGVDVFFVLSGFLITSLALGEHDATTTVSAGAFYVRRARRLLPAAVTTVVVTVALAATLQPDSARGTTRGQGIASLLYTANWWSIGHNDSYQATFGAESPLSHFWSLAVEEQFYLLFPLALVGVIVLVRRRQGGSRTLAGAVLAAATAGALASAVLMAVLYDPAGDPSRVYFGTDTRIQAPLLGVAGACAWWLWSDRVRRHRGVLAGVAALVLLVLGWVAVASGFRDAWLYDFGFLAVAAGTLLVVLAVCAGRSPVTRVFELRWLCVLGLVSYSVYLWHWPVRVFLTSDSTPFSGWMLFVARVAVTAVAATASYLLVEQPFRRSRQPRRVAGLWLGGIAVGALAVWVIARPVPAPASEFTSAEAPVVQPAVGAPLRVLWLGDSVAWTMGGGHLDFPQPLNFDNPFDPERIVIWNKADYSCPLVATPKRTMGVVKEKTGWCVHKDTEWPKLLDQFPADAVLWSATMFDSYDNQVDGRWLTFASPEWDQLYLDDLEQARAIATSRGAVFVLLGQADPVANPDEPDQESLLPENVWRWGHVRDLQRRFADDHGVDTRFVDLQPIVCPDDSCASLTIEHPGMRSDGVHFLPGAMAPIAPQVQAAIETALGRAG
jgi:peptidoglycan/LPS O-acetylase OafA/YrhL